MNDTRKNRKSNKEHTIEKLDFQKVITQKIPYSIFMNTVIQNIHNAEALAVYVYLYSLPPNWEINKEHLQNKFNLGDKKMRSIFSYLNRSNLLEYVKYQDQKTGRMLGTAIHLLNGEKFDPSIPFKGKESIEAKIASVEITEAAISDPVDIRPCGAEGQQKKHKYKTNKNKKETKSFYAQKTENEKKHDFAESMNQMANEKRHIEANEEAKRAPMPDNLRKLFRLPDR